MTEQDNTAPRIETLQKKKLVGMLKYGFFFTLSVFLAGTSSAQGLEKTFSGWWATTAWTFQFHENGTYTRTSMGHYGNTEVKGKYIMHHDTIQLLRGFEKTHGTVNEYYLLDKDSFLIDLYLRYDYAPVKNHGEINIHNSRIRKVKYPDTKTNDTALIAELEKVLNLAFNTDTAKYFYDFSNHPERTFMVTSYGYLSGGTVVDGHKAIFKPKDSITEKFFIEIIDINQNPENIDIKIHINEANVYITFYFIKTKGNWICRDPYVWKI